MANFTPAQIKKQLSGPVFPILTAFKEDCSTIDGGAVASYIEFLIQSGAKNIMTTVGTSRFNLLSEPEIFDVNRILGESVSTNVISIAAGPSTGNLQSNILFARHAEEQGIDAYIACYPERWYGDDYVFDFFAALCESVSIGIMVHETPMKSGYGGQLQYSFELLDRLVSLPNFVGMKEECMDGGYAYRLHRHFSDECSIIGAGAMRNYMRDFHAGAKANLVGVGSFFPGVELEFHEAMNNGDIERAHKIVRKYEDPYFDKAVDLGWHVQLKEVLDYFSLMPAFERLPLVRLKRDRRERLYALLDELKWKKLSPDHRPD